jgi:hypothetical protein
VIKKSDNFGIVQSAPVSIYSYVGGKESSTFAVFPQFSISRLKRFYNFPNLMVGFLNLVNNL